MDMSKAALAPRSGAYSKRDEKHALFPKYRNTLASCRRLMIDAPSFADWLNQYETNQRMDELCKHPRYIEFVRWMKDNRGGSRDCPAGNSFPHNFHYWLAGNVW